LSSAEPLLYNNTLVEETSAVAHGGREHGLPHRMTAVVQRSRPDLALAVFGGADAVASLAQLRETQLGLVSYEL
jgi:hypothetical protein